MKKRPEEKQYRDTAQKILSTSPSELALQELSLEQNGDTMIKLSNLTPHPDNPRKITDAQMAKLKESIRRDPEYMQPRPLVVNQDNIILAGNQRWKALQALGHDEIPEDWVRFVDWDEEKSRRFVIMDNHQSGEWDEEILLARWMDVDLEGLGILDVNDVAPLDDMPALPDGDREPFQQMTFTLHDEQVEQVKAAIDVAKGMGSFDSPNENSNGNALARVCEAFLTSHAHS